MSSSQADKTVLQASWETHKSTIQHLYLAGKKTCEEVRKIMRESYDFPATYLSNLEAVTKSQYERHFKEWGFRKHLRRDEWMALESRLLKRKMDGKESDVYVDGKLLSPKKIRKEIGRTCPALAVERYPQAPSPELPCGVMVNTPGPGPSIMPLFVLRDLPYLQFEALFDPQSCGLLAPHGSEIPEISLPPSASTAIFTGPSAALRLAQADHSHFMDIRSGIIKEISKTSHEGSIEGGQALMSAVRSIMPDSAEEGYPNSWVVSTSNPQDAASQLLKITLFLLSNNFLGRGVNLTGKIMAWLKSTGNTEFLEPFLSAKGPAFESLAENLFRSAIESEDIQIPRILLRAGLDPNEQVCVNGYGRQCSALQRACQLCNLALVRALIDAGANVNQKHTLGKSLLEIVHAEVGGRTWEYTFIETVHVREMEKNSAIALYLIEKGAEVNWCDNNGSGPLLIAALNQQLYLVEALLQAGVDVNQRDKWGLTALLAATTRHPREERWRNDVAMSIAIVQALLKAGAKVDILIEEENYKHPIGTTALERAAKWGSTGLCQLLLNAGAAISDGTLVFAVMSNSIELVRMLLNAGLNVNHFLRGGQYALEQAIENENEELVKLVLASGAHVNPKFNIGGNIRVKTPLQAASRCHNVNLAKILVDLGADVNAEAPFDSKYERTGGTALQEAAAKGNAHLVEFLLDASADVMSSPQILVDVIRGRNAAIVHTLLDKGAQINLSPHSERFSPLKAAIEWGDSAIIRRLLEAGAADEYALLAAIESGNLDVFQVLLDAGVAHESALPLAVASGHPEIVRLLLDAGAETNRSVIISEGIRGALRLSLLTAAIQKRDMKTVNLLLKAGVDVNHPLDKYEGQTALEAATRTGDLPLVQSLLHGGANPDDPNALLAAVETPENFFFIKTLLAARSRVYGRPGTRYGCTALQRAIRKGDTGVVKILLCAGVDCNIPTTRTYKQGTTHENDSIRFQETALGTAIVGDQQKTFPIVREILNAGADPNSVVSQSPCLTALLAAIDIQNSELVQLLIDAGANVNAIATNKLRRTALQAAAEKGSLAIVQILLKARADVNALPAPDGGATALQMSAIGGYVGIAYILIKGGAEVNAARAEKNGRTALEGAAEYGRIDMLQMLLDAGADLEGPGEDQYKRALHFASKNGHNAVRRLLQAHRAPQPMESDTQVADKCNEAMSFQTSETRNIHEPSFDVPDARDLDSLNPPGLEGCDFTDLFSADSSGFYLPNISGQTSPTMSDFAISDLDMLEWEGLERIGDGVPRDS